MDVDTGAEASVISDYRKQLFPDCKLNKSSVRLNTYTGEAIPVVGELPVNVTYGSQSVQLTLVVVSSEGPTLLGRNWLKVLKLDWCRIGKVALESAADLQCLLDQHKAIFADELGTITTHTATLQVCPDATPKFFKPRPVPFAIKDTIGSELDHLESEGIVEKVSHSSWAAPIVAVPKKDGHFHICGDYKVKVNTALNIDQ